MHFEAAARVGDDDLSDSSICLGVHPHADQLSRVDDRWSRLCSVAQLKVLGGFVIVSRIALSEMRSGS